MLWQPKKICGEFTLVHLESISQYELQVESAQASVINVMLHRRGVIVTNCQLIKCAYKPHINTDADILCLTETHLKVLTCDSWE